MADLVTAKCASASRRGSLLSFIGIVQAAALADVCRIFGLNV